MFKILDIKDILKIGFLCIIVSVCFLCYHFYTITVEQSKQIDTLKSSIQQKQEVIEKLTSSINNKINDIQTLNTKFSDIENKYKEKISTLLNQMKPSENSTQENEILIGIFNRTLSEISTVSGGSK